MVRTTLQIDDRLGKVVVTAGGQSLLFVARHGLCSQAAMIGMSRPNSSWRIFLVASQPSITGIFRSMKMRSDGGERLHDGQRLLAVAGFDDIELADAFEAIDEDTAIVEVVFDDQNPLRLPFAASVPIGGAAWLRF